jgi:hypothetical protein
LSAALADDLKEFNQHNVEVFVVRLGKDGGYIDAFLALFLYNKIFRKQLKLRMAITNPLRLVRPSDIAIYDGMRHQVAADQEVGDAPMILYYHNHFDLIDGISILSLYHRSCCCYSFLESTPLIALDDDEEIPYPPPFVNAYAV